MNNLKCHFHIHIRQNINFITKDKNLFKFPGTRLVRSNEEDTDRTEANNRER